jgi:hypothetical protein
MAMISIKLRGGLCNAMFQIATIEYLGKAFKKDITYTNVDGWIDGLKDNAFWLHNTEEYLYIFPNIDFYKNHNKRFTVKRIAEVTFRYSDILPEDGDLFVGYFQSELNFPDREFIEWLFAPSKELKKLMSKYDNLFKETTCSIHVRRGDYLNWESVHPVLKMGYYHDAIKYFGRLGIKKYLVFSDDIFWCKNNFIGDKFVFIEDVDYVELFLMSKCDCHIISNSSYGWWGAWLGETPEKPTIAPIIWFGKDMPVDHDADIVPRHRWMKL